MGSLLERFAVVLVLGSVYIAPPGVRAQAPSVAELAHLPPSARLDAHDGSSYLIFELGNMTWGDAARASFATTHPRSPRREATRSLCNDAGGSPVERECFGLRRS